MEEKAGGSTSSGGTLTTNTNSLACLNFGRKIYLKAAGGGRSQEAPPPQFPVKRGRNGAAQSHQPPRCQVEGCQVDLSDAKVYYSRHKVCGMHSKSPKVMVGGLEQRFCQQCSRFHQLDEFDQVKRSCRRRLAGHNERRRKPQPGTFAASRYRSLSSSTLDNYSKTIGGGLMMDFSSQSMSAEAADSWQNIAAKSCNQFLPRQINSQQHPDVLTTTQPGYSGVSLSSDSTSALSLLSNQPWISTSQSSSLDILGAAVALPSPAASAGQFPFPASWGFKQRNPRAPTNVDLLHQIPPPPHDLGFDQISHPAASSQALARPNDRKYGEVKPPRSSYDDDSAQHLQWSL